MLTLKKKTVESLYFDCQASRLRPRLRIKLRGKRQTAAFIFAKTAGTRPEPLAIASVIL